MALPFAIALAGGPAQPWRAASISTRTAAPDDARATIESDDTARRVVRDVLAGDRDAFRVLVERELPAVVRVCYRVLGNRDEAEDAAQETFVSAYRSLPSWRGDGPFGAWIARIALHIALRRARQAKPVAWIDTLAVDGPGDDLLDGHANAGSQRRIARHFGEASAAAAPVTDPARIALTAERATAVREALAGLEEPYRETVALRYFAGLTVPEIAEACGRPQGTIKTHLHRGLLRLRDRLDAAGMAQ
jgi:RNA polymerase sigma-70 factor (ECF subfamily)